MLLCCDIQYRLHSLPNIQRVFYLSSLAAIQVEMAERWQRTVMCKKDRLDSMLHSCASLMQL